MDIYGRDLNKMKAETGRVHERLCKELFEGAMPFSIARIGEAMSVHSEEQLYHELAPYYKGLAVVLEKHAEYLEDELVGTGTWSPDEELQKEMEGVEPETGMMVAGILLHRLNSDAEH